MKFNYDGISSHGENINGIIEADSLDQASLMLADEGVTVRKLVVASSVSVLSDYYNNYKKKYATVKLQDLIIFTRQFSTLFGAGIPVMTILNRLHSQSMNEKLQDKLRIIIDDVSAGAPLTVAFGKHDDVFSELYVNMLRVGEEGGVLDIVLDRLANILEADLETRNRIKTATRYPKMVISAIVIAFGILITFVIPKFVGLFSKFGSDLPLPTRILIGINSFVTNYWWLALLLIVSAVIGYMKFKKTEKGTYILNKYVFKIPVIGDLIHKIFVSRITRILGLLYQSGIPIVTSFDIIAEVSGNVVLKESIYDIKSSVSQGVSIAASFEDSEYFPLVVSDMISAGEETGQLDEMLFKIADYYDEAVDYSIKNLSSAIEPILLLFIAGMVVLLALGVFLPMWDMISVFK